MSAVAPITEYILTTINRFNAVFSADSLAELRDIRELVLKELETYVNRDQELLTGFLDKCYLSETVLVVEPPAFEPVNLMFGHMSAIKMETGDILEFQIPLLGVPVGSTPVITATGLEDMGAIAGGILTLTPKVGDEGLYTITIEAAVGLSHTSTVLQVEVFPTVQTGSITVNLVPDSVGAWKIVGETGWLESGYAVTGLMSPGDYEITFAAMPGYDSPTPLTIPLASGENAAITAMYKIAPLPADNPPVIDPIGNVEVVEGEELFVVFTFSDPEGDPITVSVSGQPPGTTLTQTSSDCGSLHLSTTYGDAGVYTVIVTAAANGKDSSETFLITVTMPDADSDGFADYVDSFMHDPAASKDSDGDGRPDCWNEGKNGADSTTGLYLDAYPTDPAKWFFDDGSYNYLLFFEDWESGVLEMTKWTAFGSPLPKVEPNVGNQGFAFDNNGDPSYNSGALGIESFDFSKGLLIGTDMFVNSNPAGCWMGGSIGLAKDPKAYGNTVWPGYSVGMVYSYSGRLCWADPDPKDEGILEMFIDLGDGTVESKTITHENSFLDSWHRFEIEIRPNRTAGFMIDGILMWETKGLISLDYNNHPLLLGLRSSSYGKTYHDNLSVYSSDEVKQNRAPVLTSIGNMRAAADTELTFIVTAIDPDGDNLIFNGGDLPAGAYLNSSTGLFTYKPIEADVGKDFTVTFNVTDNGIPQMGDSETITITVGAANQPPKLDMIGIENVISVSEGDLVNFPLTGTDPENTPLTFELHNLPPGASFVSPNFTWQTSYGHDGRYILNATLTDSGTPAKSDSKTITIYVGDVNRAPVITAIGNQTITENSLLAFSVTASDPDSDALTIGALNLPAGAAFTNQSFSWVPSYNQSGTYVLYFRVEDDGSPQLNDTETVTITVGNVNRPPILNTIGPRSLNVNAQYTFTVNGTDPDGNPLTYSAIGLPAGAALDQNSGVFSWTPGYNQSGSYQVTFAATDGEFTATETVTITVNRPPVLGAIGPKSGRVGKLLQFTATATDPDNDTLTYAIAPTPWNAVIDTGSGQFGWTPTEQGTFSITFTVTDGVATDTETVTFIISPFIENNGGGVGGGCLIETLFR
jgi:hypothetical protein